MSVSQEYYTLVNAHNLCTTLDIIDITECLDVNRWDEELRIELYETRGIPDVTLFGNNGYIRLI